MATSGARRKELHRHQRVRRGAASVEAVVSLPILVLLLVSAIHLRELMVGKQAAEMRARSCAWLYSADSCRHIPPGCEGVLAAGRQASGTPSVSAALAEGRRRVERKQKGEIVSSMLASLVGGVLEGFGRSLDAHVTHDVARPPLLGGDTAVVAGRYHLPCNLSPTTLVDTAKQAWEIFDPL